MNDISEFLIILDRSGSMQTAASDHEGGLNSFIQDQKQLDGDVHITLIQFDSGNPCEVVMDGVRLHEAPEVHLRPRGGTPLYAAIGSAITHFSQRLDNLKQKPDLIVAMVITDGEDTGPNGEWNRDRVKAMVAEKEKAGWKFLYLGANVDAFQEAVNIGTQATAQASMNYSATPIGTQNLYAAVTSGAVCARMATRAMKTSLSLESLSEEQQVICQNNAYSNFNWTGEQKLASMGQGSCTCVAFDLANGGGKAGDPNCPIHAREVQLRVDLGVTTP